MNSIASDNNFFNFTFYSFQGINPFPDFDGPEVVEIPLSRPYARDCTPPDSNPPAMIFWILRSPDNVKHISGINSSHISSNERVLLF